MISYFHQSMLPFPLNSIPFLSLSLFLHLTTFEPSLDLIHIYCKFISILLTSQSSNFRIHINNLFLFLIFLSKLFLNILLFIQIKLFLFQIHFQIKLNVSTFIIISPLLHPSTIYILLMNLIILILIFLKISILLLKSSLSIYS